MCQGCRSTLRTADGMIPPPPYDLTIARAERHSFRDTAGNVITPGKETTSYYHCRIDLIVQAQQEYRGDSWLKYDIAFCKKASNRRLTKWADIDSM